MRSCEWVKAYKIENWSIYVKENTCYVLEMQYNRSIVVQYKRMSTSQMCCDTIQKVQYHENSVFSYPALKIESLRAVYELIQYATNIQSNCFYCWKLWTGKCKFQHASKTEILNFENFPFSKQRWTALHVDIVWMKNTSTSLHPNAIRMKCVIKSSASVFQPHFKNMDPLRILHKKHECIKCW